MESSAAKRYQVFISSTFKDLKEEREEVLKALLELDCIPSGMELFPASDEEQLTLIKQVIDDCDYYVVIVGGRYGSVDAEGISYTEREYDYALSKGIPILAFVNGNPDEIPAGKTEMDAEARKKLDAFRNKVMTNRLIKKYSSPQELGGYVSRSLIREIKSNPRPGWVRSDEALPPETLAELNELRKKLSETENQIKTQSQTPPPGTENLMQGKDIVELHWSGLVPTSSTDFAFFSSSESISGMWKPTWDQIFKVVGPLLLNEASEGVMHRSINDYAHKAVISQKDAPKVTKNSFSIENDDFQAVKMQLFALGLIERSDRKRTASDKASYWTLTNYGERHLVSLRAMLRKEKDS